MTTSRRPRLLLYPASLRRESHQRRLLEHFAGLIGGSHHIDLLAAEDVDLPIFNQDLETSQPVLDRAIAVHARFAAADAFIVASPEYNGHVSAYLKNTVDWVSRLARLDGGSTAGNPFAGKPLLLASASTGWSGGVLGLREARSLFSYLGCLVAAEQICVSNADHWVLDGAFAFDEGFASHVARIIGSFLSLASTVGVR